MLGFYLLPVHLVSVIRILLFLFSLKLARAEMRAHYINPLEFPSDHRSLATADIIILILNPLLAQLSKRFEHAEIFDVLIDVILEGLVPNISGSDAVTQ